MEVIGLLNGLNIEISDVIDIKLTLALIVIGFVIKHFKCLKKISNEFIPVILFLVALAMTLLKQLDGMTINSVVNAFVDAVITSAIAIGIHQQGKGFLKSLKQAGIAAVKTFNEEITDEDNNDENIE